jgi:hypothetical protein
MLESASARISPAPCLPSSAEAVALVSGVEVSPPGPVSIVAARPRLRRCASRCSFCMTTRSLVVGAGGGGGGGGGGEW